MALNGEGSAWDGRLGMLWMLTVFYLLILIVTWDVFTL